MNGSLGHCWRPSIDASDLSRNGAKLVSKPARITFLLGLTIRWSMCKTRVAIGEVEGLVRCVMPMALLQDFKSPAVTETLVAESLPPRGLSVVAGHLKLRRDELHDLKVGDTLFFSLEQCSSVRRSHSHVSLSIGSRWRKKGRWHRGRTGRTGRIDVATTQPVTPAEEGMASSKTPRALGQIKTASTTIQACNARMTTPKPISRKLGCSA